MNQLAFRSFGLVSLLMLICLGGCASLTFVPDDEIGGGGGTTTSDGAGAGGGMTTSGSTSTGTGGTGGNGGVGGMGGSAPMDPLLTVAYEPLVGTEYIGCSSMWNATAPLFNFSQDTTTHALEIGVERFRIESTDGGAVVGSDGKPLFLNIRLIDKSTFYAAMGPVELVAPPGSTAAEIVMGDDFNQQMHADGEFVLVAQIGCTEAQSGESFGHHYQVVKHSFKVGDILDLTTGMPLDPSLASPPGDIPGEVFAVYAP